MHATTHLDARVPGRLQARRLAAGNTATVIFLTLVVSVATATGAFAQEAATPSIAAPPSATPAAAPAASGTPSVVQLKAAAYDAQQAAEQAEAAAAKAAQAAESARSAATQSATVGAGAAAGAVGATAAGAAAGPAVDDGLRDDLHRATEEAKNAAAAARAAAAALEQHVREREKRYSRNGFYLSGGIFWAPNLFNATVPFGNSKGAFGAVGYHVAERFEIEVRFDGLDDFKVDSPEFNGRFNAWSTTLNGKIFLLTKSFQPYIGMGIGALRSDEKYTEVSTGRQIQIRDTVALFRISSGFDFYLTETLALTADAAINLPGGELSAANYATLGGGIKLRF